MTALVDMLTLIDLNLCTWSLQSATSVMVIAIAIHNVVGETSDIHIERPFPDGSLARLGFWRSLRIRTAVLYQWLIEYKFC